MDEDIATTGTRVVYENRWMRVREDAIRRRDGSAGIYGVVEKPDFVVVAPVEAGVVHLVQQYRYPVRGRWWELPQGVWDARPSRGDPIDGEGRRTPFGVRPTGGKASGAGPEGCRRSRQGADPVEAARGELAEETGLRAATMAYAGRLFTAYGIMNQGCHVFLASGLTPGEAAPETEEQDLISRAFPLSEVEAMVRDGAIADSITVAALGLLRLKGML